MPAKTTTPLDVGQLLAVLDAVRKGDFAARMPVDRTGVAGKVCDALNEIVELNAGLAAELARLNRVVGKEGKTSHRGRLAGAKGAWAECVDSVNGLVADLVQPSVEVTRVIGAVARGDLGQAMALEIDGRPLQGEFLRTAGIVNTMVAQLSSFASEVTRVAREVGTEGKLGGQAVVKGVSGTWKDLTDNVNSMASNLTAQVRAIAEVTTAVANGDLSRKITVDVRGEILELKNTINVMVDQLSSFASEVTRVAREVGTEGKLGGQAVVKGVSGTWKDLTDNVNSMASNLTAQVRAIAEVTTAVATGDLSKKITVDVKGEILELKNTINVMVDQLSSFASEVTRVAREVGTEGKLGGQAVVKGVAGTWKDLTDNVNSMASNLTVQLRDVSKVATAIANGDLGQKITVDVQGEILQIKDVINKMVDQLSSFASEVTRVAREVGTEGKLGGQADVRGVAGTWKDLTDSVNSMASGLTAQVRDIAKVATAVANGDLSQKIAVDVRGEILELKNTINGMVDNLRTFSTEVTRVAREVGTEGKLGGQAVVKGVAGTWKDLTDNVNSMASNLTVQLRDVSKVATAIANGDLGQKITVDVQGEILQIKNTINVMVDQLSSFASEVTRVAREVGTEGKLGGQADVKGVSGTWKDLTDSVNHMASNLTSQVRNIAAVTTAVATGDLTKKITVDVRGEMLELKNTINVMVDQLSSFASEVTRVAREVGTEGKLGGQADVKGVSGTWKDLTDNVNWMASNLTAQVRGIATVVTAVAAGDLGRKLALEAKGEIAALADTINGMIDTLATFADQVTNVAREVGTEGKLGGQARVPGAAGVWRDLTDNVNSLAANLTTQVRAIAEVATAVTKGDLTRSIAVGAQGEVAALKDNINQMISNLRATTQKNTEQDWLKTNLARFTRMLQGQRDLEAVGKLILKELAPLVEAQMGVFYLLEEQGGERVLQLLSSFAFRERKGLSNRFKPGEGLVGQCVLEKDRILVTDLPEDYTPISSGLGEGKPRSVVVLPILFEGEVKAVIELASFHRFGEIHLAFLDQLTESIGIVLNTIAASMRTEELLKQSQSLAEELRAQQAELTDSNRRLEQQANSLQASEDRLRNQQEELQRTNEELEERSRLLEVQNVEVERKNREIEQAKSALEERAQQLAVTSKYKSEFLANMSHELRTPLNSMLVLSKLLSDNADGNLSPKQVDFAQTIHSAGADLLALINDILDLSKIESGAMQVDVSECLLAGLQDYIERAFRQLASQKGLRFAVEVDRRTPSAIWTDERRLQQIVRNLLSNAFKFTEHGEVVVRIAPARGGWSRDAEGLNAAGAVLALSVRDTGIGIAPEKQRIIFEAFQQADGTTSRKYGGTGLGLSISRELAKLLGGELAVESSPGKGSTFTLYLPEARLTVPAAPPNVAVAIPGVASRDGLPAAVPAGAEATSGLQPPVSPGLAASVEPLAAKGILVVVPDARLAATVEAVARDRGFAVWRADASDAVRTARERRPDGLVIEVGAAAGPEWSVLERLKEDPDTREIPLHVLTAPEPATEDTAAAGDGASAPPPSRAAGEHAADEVALFLHRVDAELPERKRALVRAATADASLVSKKILIVDDDVRNVFAITALLEQHGASVVYAENGRRGLEVLKANPGVDLVLMDVMMPELDGYETMRAIRHLPEYERLPIIALTAKAMKGDREKCVESGASDYVTKPVKAEQILSLLRVWLYRRPEPRGEARV
jgi:HAMP domain-containing protein/signal transduction histidine kinase/DNA-binding response OmpR family regulator